MSTWNTPFYSYYLLVALGVDYSIFHLVRVREHALEGGTMTTRNSQAASDFGAVDFSAANYCSGTFAAMIPSGITTLILVALADYFGHFLLVYCLPLVMSSVNCMTDRTMKTKQLPEGPGPHADPTHKTPAHTTQ